MSLCPKCGNTDEATIWEDNFWSGCDKCGWCASCEGMFALVKTQPQPRNPYWHTREDEEE